MDADELQLPALERRGARAGRHHRRGRAQGPTSPHRTRTANTPVAYTQSSPAGCSVGVRLWAVAGWRDDVWLHAPVRDLRQPAALRGGRHIAGGKVRRAGGGGLGALPHLRRRCSARSASGHQRNHLLLSVPVLDLGLGLRVYILLYERYGKVRRLYSWGSWAFWERALQNLGIGVVAPRE